LLLTRPGTVLGVTAATAALGATAGLVGAAALLHRPERYGSGMPGMPGMTRAAAGRRPRDPPRDG
jgi:hypothetical protein